tara:strand:+ start:18124 stop:18969 length:846 start_codon:yes stop_codon:yes gene_type:complete
MKNKIVVVGNKGFIGSETYNLLKRKKYNVFGISKTEVDLTKKSSSEKLDKIINDGDTIIFVSAIAPCKELKCIKKNILMVENFIEGVGNKKLKQLINISSDAVYSDSSNKINESSQTNPNSFHGIMHNLRENILNVYFGNILTIVRPTLVYGLNDPHNGYGPNKFRRLIDKDIDITLFGKGEEKRDHVYVGDISLLVEKIIKNKEFGIFNAVSSQVLSFNEIANFQKKIKSSKIKINNTKRIGPMPHDGLRQFSPSKGEKIFKDFKFTKIKTGIKRYLYGK